RSSELITSAEAGFNLIVTASTGDHYQMARSAQNRALPIDAFLNLSASHTVAQEAAPEWPGISVDVGSAGVSTGPERVAATEGLFSKTTIALLENAFTEEQAAQPLLRSGQGDEMPAAISSQCEAESADEAVDDSARSEN